MGKIQVLDKQVAELIAAGEVVERPSSIAKELLENSIDAGATAITVEIRGGGVGYLRVSDDGCGIARDDLPRAFLRHATSKVRTADDLDGILTLGFRGEALASISAVSRVEMTTKTAEEEVGSLCRVEGGSPLRVEDAGCPTGTTIVIQDVFYNTPARMKFLKKDVSEGNSVAQVVDKCALSHPEIAFRMIRDGQTKLQTSGNGDLLSVILAVYGKELAGQMTPVDYTSEEGIRVHGYISKPSGARASRAYQNFYINQRFVKTRTAAAALEEAFKNKLMGGKFPACVLNLDLDAASVDVNVHPAKIEVRFVQEKPIFQAVYFAVKSSLAKLEAPIPLHSSMTTAAEAPNTTVQQQTITPAVSTAAYQTYSGVKGEAPQRMTAQEFQVLFADKPEEKAFTQPISFHASKNLDIAVEDDEFPIKPARSPFSEEKVTGPPVTIAVAPEEMDISISQLESVAPQISILEEQDLRLIGELFGTYILLEQGEDLLLVDKHAAHERILYEQLKENLRYGNRQVLLEAQTLSLTREECGALLENTAQLEALGFTIDDFGDGTVIVREIPIELGQRDVAQVVGEIADRLLHNRQDLTPEVLDRLYYNIACRSAVKAHDKNNRAELQEIVDRLRQNPDITHCPHGRPVSVRMSRQEIEKQFGRLV